MHEMLIVGTTLAAMDAVEQFLDNFTERGPVANTRTAYIIRDHAKFSYFAVVLLFIYHLFCRDYLNDLSFSALGIFSFIRLFGCKHEVTHSLHASKPWWFAVRLLDIPSSPLQVGFDDLAEIHKLHHLHHKDPKSVADPDAYLIDVPWLESAWNCFWDAELATILYTLRTQGKTFRRTLVGALYKTCILGALWWYGGNDKFLVYLGTTRTANFLTMFLFHKVLHDGVAYTKGMPYYTPFPTLARWIIRICFGKDILSHVMMHELHHTRGDIHVKFLLKSK